MQIRDKIRVEVRIKPSSDSAIDSTSTNLTLGTKKYSFSKVHLTTTQSQMYMQSVSSMVTQFVEGYNCTVLAYGQTGSGKTYTMGINSDGGNGIVQNMLRDLFRRLNTKQSQAFCTENEAKQNEVKQIDEEMRTYRNRLEDNMRLGFGIDKTATMGYYTTNGLSENVYSGLLGKNKFELNKRGVCIKDLNINNLSINSDELGCGKISADTNHKPIGDKNSHNTQIPSNSSYELSISFIEIYNEEVIDLLSDNKKPLSLRELNGDITVSGAMELKIQTESDAITCLQSGCLERTTKSTRMNSASSRSHAIFMLNLRRCVNDKFICSRFYFVDLAGSERLKRTLCSGQRAKESISINSGLLALGNVISALYKGAKHVPFRDSKLTRILQSCLNGHVLMIACISSVHIDMHETHNTLKYASRAASIETRAKPRIEIDNSKMAIIMLKKEVEKLRVENQRLVEKIRSSGRIRTDEIIKENRILKQKLDQLSSKISHDNSEDLAQEVLKHPFVQNLIEENQLLKNELSKDRKMSNCIDKDINQFYASAQISDSVYGLEMGVGGLDAQSTGLVRDRYTENYRNAVSLSEPVKRTSQNGQFTIEKKTSSGLVCSSGSCYEEMKNTEGSSFVNASNKSTNSSARVSSSLIKIGSDENNGSYLNTLKECKYENSKLMLGRMQEFENFGNNKRKTFGYENNEGAFNESDAETESALRGESDLQSGASKFKSSLGKNNEIEAALPSLEISYEMHEHANTKNNDRECVLQPSNQQVPVDFNTIRVNDAKLEMVPETAANKVDKTENKHAKFLYDRLYAHRGAAKRNSKNRLYKKKCEIDKATSSEAHDTQKKKVEPSGGPHACETVDVSKYKTGNLTDNMSTSSMATPLVGINNSAKTSVSCRQPEISETVVQDTHGIANPTDLKVTNHATSLKNVKEPTIHKGHKRLVTFNLPEPTKKYALFTPRKEKIALTTKIVSTLNGYTASSVCILNKVLVFSSIDNKVRMWDKSVSVLFSDENVRSVFSFSDSVFYTTRSLLKCFDVRSGTRLVYACKSEISAFRIWDNLLVTGHEDGSFQVVDLRNFKAIYSERPHSGTVFSIERVNDDVFTASRDHTISVCALFGEQNVKVVNTRSSGYLEASRSNVGVADCKSNIASFSESLVPDTDGSSSGCMNFHANTSKLQFKTLNPPHYDAVHVLLNYKGDLVSFGRDCSLKRWHGSSIVKTVPYAHDSWIKSGAVCDDFFVSGSKCGTIRMWDFCNNSVFCVGRTRMNGSVNCIANDGRMIYAGMQNKEISVLQCEYKE